MTGPLAVILVLQLATLAAVIGAVVLFVRHVTADDRHYRKSLRRKS